MKLLLNPERRWPALALIGSWSACSIAGLAILFTPTVYCIELGTPLGLRTSEVAAGIGGILAVVAFVFALDSLALMILAISTLAAAVGVASVAIGHIASSTTCG